MDSQIEQLPDLSGYLKFASVPDWQRVTLRVPGDSGGTRASTQAMSFWRQWRANNAPAEKRSSRDPSTEPHLTRPVSREGDEYE
jgi:hypothetical protein